MAKSPKALEKHTRAFYDILVSLGEPDPELENALVVEVRLSQLFKECGIPGTYYARIRAILFDGADPCVVMLSRGVVGRPSVVCLRHPPSKEIFTDEGLTTRPHTATLYADATARIKQLEAWRETVSPAGFNVVEALRDHEHRLARLEAQMAEMPATQERQSNGKKAQDAGSD